MRNSPVDIVHVANNLMNILSSIDNLLKGYEGIDGNKEYVAYCQEKCMESYDFAWDLFLITKDFSEGKGVNVHSLLMIIQREYRILDDIDSASDMFKPKWCRITILVNEIQKLKNIYCSFDHENRLVIPDDETKINYVLTGIQQYLIKE